MRPHAAIAVDWSARSTPSPARPSPDACWIAWGTPNDSPPPEYFPTRAACEARLAELIRTIDAPTILGFDFPLGYPLAVDGSPVMPAGRELCALLAARIEDDHTNANNRFDVAEQLNAEIAARFNEPHGPFWGCPNARESANGVLLPTKRVMRAVPEYRAVERHVRSTRKLAIQSAWKLYTTGSVGSQTLLGLPAVHRLLDAAGDRARLWPFEPIDRPDAVVFAEIWPSLHDASAHDHPIKDARQVLATRTAMLRTTLTPPPQEHARVEGWIMSAGDPTAQSSVRSESHTV